MGGYGTQPGPMMEYLDTIQEYDTLTDTWVVKSPMPIPRYNFCPITGTDGNIYVIGGRTLGNDSTDRVDAYNPITSVWIQKASMPNEKSEFAAVLLNGDIYAIGGSSRSWPNHVDEFNYNNNTWTSKGQFPGDDSTRYCLGAAALENNIYAIGGIEEKSGDPNLRVLNTVEAVLYPKIKI